MKFFSIGLFLLIVFNSLQGSTIPHKRSTRALNTSLQTDINGTYHRTNPSTNTEVERSSYKATHEFQHHIKEEEWSDYAKTCSDLINNFLKSISDLIAWKNQQNGTFSFNLNTTISQIPDDETYRGDKKPLDNTIPTIIIKSNGKIPTSNECRHYQIIHCGGESQPLSIGVNGKNYNCYPVCDRNQKNDCESIENATDTSNDAQTESDGCTESDIEEEYASTVNNKNEEKIAEYLSDYQAEYSTEGYLADKQTTPRLALSEIQTQAPDIIVPLQPETYTSYTFPSQHTTNPVEKKADKSILVTQTQVSSQANTLIPDVYSTSKTLLKAKNVDNQEIIYDKFQSTMAPTSVPYLNEPMDYNDQMAVTEISENYPDETFGIPIQSTSPEPQPVPDKQTILSEYQPSLALETQTEPLMPYSNDFSNPETGTLFDQLLNFQTTKEFLPDIKTTLPPLPTSFTIGHNKKITGPSPTTSPQLQPSLIYPDQLHQPNSEKPVPDSLVTSKLSGQQPAIIYKSTALPEIQSESFATYDGLTYTPGPQLQLNRNAPERPTTTVLESQHELNESEQYLENNVPIPLLFENQITTEEPCEDKQPLEDFQSLLPFEPQKNTNENYSEKKLSTEYIPKLISEPSGVSVSPDFEHISSEPYSNERISSELNPIVLLELQFEPTTTNVEQSEISKATTLSFETQSFGHDPFEHPQPFNQITSRSDSSSTTDDIAVPIINKELQDSASLSTSHSNDNSHAPDFKTFVSEKQSQRTKGYSSQPPLVPKLSSPEFTNPLTFYETTLESISQESLVPKVQPSSTYLGQLPVSIVKKPLISSTVPVEQLQGSLYITNYPETPSQPIYEILSSTSAPKVTKNFFGTYDDRNFFPGEPKPEQYTDLEQSLVSPDSDLSSDSQITTEEPCDDEKLDSEFQYSKNPNLENAGSTIFPAYEPLSEETAIYPEYLETSDFPKTQKVSKPEKSEINAIKLSTGQPASNNMESSEFDTFATPIQQFYNPTFTTIAPPANIYFTNKDKSIQTESPEPEQDSFAIYNNQQSQTATSSKIQTSSEQQWEDDLNPNENIHSILTSKPNSNFIVDNDEQPLMSSNPTSLEYKLEMTTQKPWGNEFVTTESETFSVPKLHTNGIPFTDNHQPLAVEYPVSVAPEKQSDTVLLNSNQPKETLVNANEEILKAIRQPDAVVPQKSTSPLQVPLIYSSHLLGDNSKPLSDSLVTNSALDLPHTEIYATSPFPQTQFEGTVTGVPPIFLSSVPEERNEKFEDELLKITLAPTVFPLEEHKSFNADLLSNSNSETVVPIPPLLTLTTTPSIQFETENSNDEQMITTKSQPSLAYSGQLPNYNTRELEANSGTITEMAEQPLTTYAPTSFVPTQTDLFVSQENQDASLSNPTLIKPEMQPESTTYPQPQLLLTLSPESQPVVEGTFENGGISFHSQSSLAPEFQEVTEIPIRKEEVSVYYDPTVTEPPMEVDRVTENPYSGPPMYSVSSESVFNEELLPSTPVRELPKPFVTHPEPYVEDVSQQPLALQPNLDILSNLPENLKERNREPNFDTESATTKVFDSSFNQPMLSLNPDQFPLIATPQLTEKEIITAEQGLATTTNYPDSVVSQILSTPLPQPPLVYSNQIYSNNTKPVSDSIVTSDTTNFSQTKISASTSPRTEFEPRVTEVSPAFVPLLPEDKVEKYEQQLLTTYPPSTAFLMKSKPYSQNTNFKDIQPETVVTFNQEDTEILTTTPSVEIQPVVYLPQSENSSPSLQSSFPIFNDQIMENEHQTNTEEHCGNEFTKSKQASVLFGNSGQPSVSLDNLFSPESQSTTEKPCDDKSTLASTLIPVLFDNSGQPSVSPDNLFSPESQSTTEKPCEDESVSAGYEPKLTLSPDNPRIPSNDNLNEPQSGLATTTALDQKPFIFVDPNFSPVSLVIPTVQEDKTETIPDQKQTFYSNDPQFKLVSTDRTTSSIYQSTLPLRNQDYSPLDYSDSQSENFFQEPAFEGETMTTMFPIYPNTDQTANLPINDQLTSVTYQPLSTPKVEPTIPLISSSSEDPILETVPIYIQNVDYKNNPLAKPLSLTTVNGDEIKSDLYQTTFSPEVIVQPNLSNFTRLSNVNALNSVTTKPLDQQSTDNTPIFSDVSSKKDFLAYDEAPIFTPELQPESFVTFNEEVPQEEPLVSYAQEIYSSTIAPQPQPDYFITYDDEQPMPKNQPLESTTEEPCDDDQSTNDYTAVTETQPVSSLKLSNQLSNYNVRQQNGFPVTAALHTEQPQALYDTTKIPESESFVNYDEGLSTYPSKPPQRQSDFNEEIVTTKYHSYLKPKTQPILFQIPTSTSKPITEKVIKIEEEMTTTNYPASVAPQTQTSLQQPLIMLSDQLGPTSIPPSDSLVTGDLSNQQIQFVTPVTTLPPEKEVIKSEEIITTTYSTSLPSEPSLVISGQLPNANVREQENESFVTLPSQQLVSSKFTSPSKTELEDFTSYNQGISKSASQDNLAKYNNLFITNPPISVTTEPRLGSQPTFPQRLTSTFQDFQTPFTPELNHFNKPYDSQTTENVFYDSSTTTVPDSNPNISPQAQSKPNTFINQPSLMPNIVPSPSQITNNDESSTFAPESDLLSSQTPQPAIYFIPVTLDQQSTASPQGISLSRPQDQVLNGSIVTSYPPELDSQAQGSTFIPQDTHLNAGDSSVQVDATTPQPIPYLLVPDQTTLSSIKSGEDNVSCCKQGDSQPANSNLLCPFNPNLKGNMTAPSYYILISKLPNESGDKSNNELFRVEKVYLGDGTPLNCSFSQGKTFPTSYYTPIPFSGASTIKLPVNSYNA